MGNIRLPSGYVGVLPNEAQIRVGEPYNPNDYFFINKLNALAQSLTSHENLIVHLQNGIEKLFDRIEVLEKRVFELEKKDRCQKCNGKGYNEYYVNGENSRLKTPVLCSPCKGLGVVVRA